MELAFIDAAGYPPLLAAIADGTFGLMKRPADKGRGLDGVARKARDYFTTQQILSVGDFDRMRDVELVFAGVFRFQNVPQENVQPLLMIECPRLLFPYARHLMSTVTRDGGFPPLLLEPIDFGSLYLAQRNGVTRV